MNTDKILKMFRGIICMILLHDDGNSAYCKRCGKKTYFDSMWVDGDKIQ